MKFPFYDAPNTATITCCHILENGEPILYVSHDEDDGMWQFLCGKAHETDEAKLVSLKSVFDLDNSVGILKDMPCGYYAERKAQDDEWSVRKRELSARSIQVDISHILGNLITVIFDYQILRKPLKILSL